MGFTFYGDLLGISSNYNLNERSAYEKLNDFYNIAFENLKGYCDAYPGSYIFMFSDSILFYGDDIIPALKKLHTLYLSLINSNLLLRGAIVKDKIDFEPRFELDNFIKRLPINGTLAKAVSLQNMYKGSRLIIDTALAKDLLEDIPEWLTQEGFYSTRKSELLNSDLLMRISTTPDNRCYEYLYFWKSHNQNYEFDHIKKKKELLEISKMMTSSISLHYKQTAELMKRCQNRETFIKNII
jgi:hypothetical protein